MTHCGDCKFWMILLGEEVICNGETDATGGCCTGR